MINKRTFNGTKKYVELYRVYDGDTIEIITKLDMFETKKRYMCRLKNIDSLELKPNKNIKDRPIMIEYAEKTKKILELLLTPILYIEFEEEDKYGRLLGTVYLTERIKCIYFYSYYKKGLNINSWFITNSLVNSYDGGTKEEYNIEWVIKNKENIDKILDELETNPNLKYELTN